MAKKKPKEPSKGKKKTLQKKSPIKPASKSKSKVKPKIRKPNSYFAIRSAVSKHCKEKYGKPCPEVEMRRIYYDVKRRFFPETPLQVILDEIDLILSNKDSSKFPPNLRAFPWYDVESQLFRSDGLFFRADDKITLNLEILQMGIFETTFDEFRILYREKVYHILRNRTYEIEAKNLAPSPMPEFMYKPEQSSLKDRSFVWSLTANFNIPDGFVFEDIYGSRPSGGVKVIPQTGIVSDAVRLAELKKENAILRAAELQELKLMYQDKVFTREEYATMIKAVYDKFALGGIVD